MTAYSGGNRHRRGPKATIGCEALEGRQLLSRGFGMGGLGGMGFGRGAGSARAELGSFGGGRPGAMFGSGNLGLGGANRDPLFLLTAPVLQGSSGSTTPPSRAALSSSAVQSAFQTLQTDYNNVVPAGAKPTHATVGQLQDDLLSIRKGTLTGTAATTAIQNDEAAILTSLGLTTTQVGQLQADIQGVQAAIQSAAAGATGSATLTNGGTTTTTGGATSTTTSTTPSAQAPTPGVAMGSSTTTAPAANSAVQTAMQTLQTDIQGAVSSNSQPSYATIGQVQDDLAAIDKGTLTGSQAVSTIQADTAAVFTGAGATAAQVTQIQADQSALATAIQAAQTTSGGSTSSTPSSNATASPGSIAAVQAALQSVQPYLVGVPGVGGPMMISRGTDGPMMAISQGAGATTAPGNGGFGMAGQAPTMTPMRGASLASGWGGRSGSTTMGGPATNGPMIPVGGGTSAGQAVSTPVTPTTGGTTTAVAVASGGQAATSSTDTTTTATATTSD